MQNIEIEFKNMLTENEYSLLLHEFKQSDQHAIVQVNHYFDTPTFLLKNSGSALRIRQKNDGFEMTLKQQAPVGLLETNQPLTHEEADEAILSGNLPAGMIQAIVDELGVPFNEIKYFGSLKTKRVEVEYQQGILVFDHSFYLDKEDFELEYEVQNFQNGKKIFYEFLQKFSIPERKTENKISRFYQQKYHQLP